MTFAEIEKEVQDVLISRFKYFCWAQIDQMKSRHAFYSVIRNYDFVINLRKYRYREKGREIVREYADCEFGDNHV